MTEFPETRSTLLAGIKSPENREAWEEFIAIYRPLIYRMARRRGLQDADAQDVAQDILIRVAAAIERYEPQPGVRFRHWLRRVASNAILTSLQRQPRDLSTGGTDIHEIVSQQPDLPSQLEAELETELLREMYLRAAAVVRTEVNAETWRAFDLTTLQEVSCEEAAVTIGKSVGTVYAARSRIIKRLREQLERMQKNDSSG